MQILKFFRVIISKVFLSCLISSLLWLSACAPKLGGDDYAASEAGEITSTLKGTIVATRVIKIRPDQTEKAGVGATTGMVSGAVLGSTIGGGHNMPLVSAVLGGLAAGAAGHAIEQKLTEQNGIEYQIKLQSTGEIINLAQGLEPKLAIGQKVLVIKSQRGRSRVIPDHS